MIDREQQRANAAAFHKNFSRGAFDDNGPLVAEDIAVDSNNVLLTGRDQFVERIKRYNGPFPGLQLKDRIIIVDGEHAAVHYILQGEHLGPFGDIAATGHKVEVMSGEIFRFDAHGLMAGLTTITKLDDLKAQVSGERPIDAHQQVVLLDNGEADEALEAAIRETASSFHRNFSAGEFAANGPLVDSAIKVNSNGTMVVGREQFVERIQRYRTPFPAMQMIDEIILVEGRRACVSYHMSGSHDGDLPLPDGSVLAATGKQFRFRGIEFMHFNDQAQMDELITISNFDDLLGQLRD